MFDDSIMSMSDYFMRTYRFFYWHVKLNELKYTEVEFYNIEGARQFMRVFREEDNPSGYWRKLLSMTKQHEMFIYRMSDDEVEHEIAKMLDKGYIKVCLETVNHSPFGGDYDPDDTGEITCYDPTTYKKISDDRAIRKPTKKAEEKPTAQKESKPEAENSKSSESSKPQVQENTATASNAPKNKILDAGADIFDAPKSIKYNPDGSVLFQPKGKPLCGPTSCNMIVNDVNGNIVDLTEILSKFPEVRKTGVNIKEMSSVLDDFEVSNSMTTDFSSRKLYELASNNQPTIVGVPAGSGNHFLIVDGVQVVDNVPYYLTRDPFAGPRGVRADILNNAVNINKNAILIGQ